MYANLTGSYVELFEQTNVLDFEYTFTSAANGGESITGKFFAFKVSAINVVGESDLSELVVSIAALKPLAATSLVKVSSDTT